MLVLSREPNRRGDLTFLEPRTIVTLRRPANQFSTSNRSTLETCLHPPAPAPISLSSHMGLFSRSPPPPPRVYGALELFSPPLGRDRSFCVSRETVLTIKVCFLLLLLCRCCFSVSVQGLTVAPVAHRSARSARTLTSPTRTATLSFFAKERRSASAQNEVSPRQRCQY